MRVIAIPAARDLLLSAIAGTGIGPICTRVLRRGGYPVVFAGAVRDAILTIETGATFKPRDFDIGIVGMNRAAFRSAFMHQGAANRHGGFRLERRGICVDAWRVEDTVGIRALRVPCTVTNILRSFVLSLNAVAFDPQSGRFFDEGCLDAVKSREVRLVERPLLHDEDTFSAKALISEVRFNFTVNPLLRNFTKAFLSRNALAHEAAKMGADLCAEVCRRTTVRRLAPTGDAPQCCYSPLT
jgi:hypothetical protein